MESFNYENFALEILSSKSYLSININLLKKVGPDAAVFLSNLINKYRYFKSKNQLVDNGFFYLKNDIQMESTGLNLHKLQACKLFYKTKEILESKLKGAPPVELYKINFENLLNFISPSALTLNCRTNRLLTVAQTDEYNIKIKENKIKENIIPPNGLLNGKISSNQFDKFWRIYPKKVNKGDALTAWNKLCLKNIRPTWIEIRKAVNLQSDSQQWQDPTFIPHASSWLNGSKWLNDPTDMIVYTRKDFSKKVEEDDWDREPLPDRILKLHKND